MKRWLRRTGRILGMVAICLLAMAGMAHAGPDTFDGTVSITAPSPGTVSGIVTITATACESEGIGQCNTCQDTGTACDPSPSVAGATGQMSPAGDASMTCGNDGTFTLNWDTTAVGNGSWNIRVACNDFVGPQQDSGVQVVAVTVNNASPPSVVSGPAASATDTGTHVDSPFTITAVFNDNGDAVSGCEYTTNGSAWSAGTVSGSGASTQCETTGATCTDAASLTINMRATNANGTTTATSIARTCDAAAPTIGTFTATTGTLDGEIDLAWSATDSGSGMHATTAYIVVRGTNAGDPTPADCASGTQVYSGTAGSPMTENSLTPSGTYNYRFCAYDVLNQESTTTASALAKGSDSHNLTTFNDNNATARQAPTGATFEVARINTSATGAGSEATQANIEVLGDVGKADVLQVCVGYGTADQYCDSTLASFPSVSINLTTAGETGGSDWIFTMELADTAINKQYGLQVTGITGTNDGALGSSSTPSATSAATSHLISSSSDTSANLNVPGTQEMVSAPTSKSGGGTAATKATISIGGGGTPVTATDVTLVDIKYNGVSDGSVNPTDLSNIIIPLGGGNKGSGTWTVEITLAATADGKTFNLTLWNIIGTDNANLPITTATRTATAAGNTAPSDPGSLAQYKVDGTTVITQGTATDETSIIIKATATDAESNYQIEAEIVENASAFTGTPNCTGGALVASGAEASVTCAGLADATDYKWQVRAKDVGALTSNWVIYGGNPDVSIALLANDPYKVDSCNDCHASPPVDDPGGIRNSLTGGLKGSHGQAKHQNLYPGYDQCLACHEPPIPVSYAHRGGTIAMNSTDIFGIATSYYDKDNSGTKTAADASFNQVNNPTYGVCRNVTCHGTGTPEWGSGSLTCTACHNDGNDTGAIINAAPDSGLHLLHIAETDYVDCNKCHGTNATAGTRSDHQNQVNNVALVADPDTDTDITEWNSGPRTCLNNCHATTSDTWDSGAVGCTDCHATGYLADTAGSMPTTGLHIITPSQTNQKHDSTVTGGCEACHTTAPSSAHMDGTNNTSWSTITVSPTGGTFADGATPTCTSTCHTDDAGWARKWSTSAANSDGSECANCHGTYALGWTTGVVAKHNVALVNASHDGSNDCITCHILGHTNYLDASNTKHRDSNIQINSNTGGLVDNGDNTVGCSTACHAETGTYSFTETFTGTAGGVDRWGRDETVAGPPITCTSCHNNGTNDGVLANAAPATGKHAKHIGSTTYVTLCNNCHGADANVGLHAGHRDSNPSFANNVTSYPGDGSCTNTCHLSVTAGDWTSTSLECVDCHDTSGVKSLDRGWPPTASLTAHVPHTSNTNYVSANCVDCHNDNTSTHSLLNNVVTGVTNKISSYTSASGTCTNTCHTGIADFTDSNPKPVCIDCHAATYLAATAGSMPLSGLHNTTAASMTSGEPHDGSFNGGASGCVDCHTLSPSGAAHMDKVNDTSSPTIVINSGTVAIGAFADGATPTCTSKCHSDNEGWARRWSDTADDNTTAECDNCHGDYSGGFVTGVIANHGGATVETKHDGTNKCVTCHAYDDGSDDWLYLTENSHRNGIIEINNQFTFVDNGATVGCTGCHGNTPQYQFTDSENSDGLGVDRWGRDQTTLTGPAASCDGCHTGTAGHDGATEDANTHNVIHNSVTSSYIDACNECHPHNGPGTPGDGVHADNTVNFANRLAGTTDYLHASANFVTCTSSNACHDSDANEWTAGNLGGDSCADCHASAGTLGTAAGGAYPPTSGTHTKHVNNTAYLTNTCEECHGTNSHLGTHDPAHKNGIVNNTLGYVAGTTNCTNSCHQSDTAADWTNGNLGADSCTDCHATGGTLSTLALNVYPPTSAKHAKHIGANAAFVPTDCDSCHGTNATTGAHGTNHKNNAIDDVVSYASATQTCTNSCHIAGTSGDWTAGGTLSCADCHTATYIAAVKGAMPSTGLHSMSNNQAHDASLGTGCGECHDNPAAATHMDNTFNADSGSNNDRFLFTAKTITYTDSTTNTGSCIGTDLASANGCHSDNGDWGRLWSTDADLTATTPGNNRCSVCHGQYEAIGGNSAGWRTGVGHLDTTTRGATQHEDTGTPTCDTCHAFSHSNYTWATNHGNAKITMNNNGTAWARGTGDYPNKSGCTPCHAGAEDGAADTNHMFTKSLLPSETVTGDAIVGGTCLGCHGEIKGSRRAVTSDFVRKSRHVNDGTTTSIVTNMDCVVCHAEGDTGSTESSPVVTSLHPMASDPVSMRNVDNVSNPGNAGTNYWNWPVSGANSTDRDNMDKFCLSCHDADGATGISVDNSNAGLLLGDTSTVRSVTGASNLNPNNVTVNLRPFNTNDNLKNGNDITTLGTFRNETYGRVLNVKDQFNSTNQTRSGWASHHNLNLYNPRYDSINANWPAATWTGYVTKDGVTMSTGRETTMLHCSDCHLNEVNAHGSVNSHYMLVGKATASDTDVTPTTGIKAAEEIMCFRCHNSAVYADDGGSTASSRHTHSDCGRQSGTVSAFGNQCNACHGGYSANTDGGLPRMGLGAIHGTNETYVPAPDENSASIQRFRFMNGGGNRFHTPSDGDTAIVVGDWEGTFQTDCYVASNDAWGSCSNHDGGKPKTPNWSRPIDY